MNYKHLLVAILFAATIFPLALATTNITVTSPNGGETFSGTKNITWDFNDTTTAQTIDFNLWYSNPAGQNNFVVAQSLPFQTYCNTPQSNNWVTSDTNYLVGLPTNVPSIVAMDSWEYAGTKYISYFRSTDSPTTKSMITYKWNSGTNSWQNANINWDNNSFSTCQTPDFGWWGLTIFNQNNSEYAIFTCDQYQTTRGFKFNGTSWSPSNDVNSGISIGSNFIGGGYMSGIESFSIGSNYYFLAIKDSGSGGMGVPQVVGFIWNGTAWTSYNPIATFDGVLHQSFYQPLFLTTLNYANNTYLIVQTGHLADNNIYIWNGSGWSSTTALSGSMPKNQPNGLVSIFTLNNFGEGLSNIMLVGNGLRTTYGIGSQNFNFNLSKKFSTSYATNSTSNCSYSWDTTTAQNGSWFIDAKAKGSTITNDSSNASFTISNYSNASLPVTPIQNITGVSYDSNTITLSTPNNATDTIWKTTNNTSGTVNVSYSVLNNTQGAYQYFAYTSSDGVNWTFNDTMTFGSTNSNPIQKIWDSTTNTYKYGVADTLTSGQVQYYKLVFASIPIYYQTIGSNQDWGNLNPPTTVVDSIGLHNSDLFQDSNYTPIGSYTIKPYPQLTSVSLQQGFEVQFTAYAEKAMTLKVGERVGSTDTTTDVAISTVPTRYSVFVAPSDYTAQILIKSLGVPSTRVYISDYAIVPKAYFLDRLDLLNAGGSQLNSVVFGGTSSVYIQETAPFQEKSRAYNQNGLIVKMRTEVLLGATLIKAYETNLTSNIPNSTIDLSQVFDGITDYNQSAYDSNTLLVNALLPLQNLTVKNTLIDSSDNNVAEQSQTIKLLQYPYFPSDLKLNVYPISTKVGTNPKFNISIAQKLPDAFIGLKFFVYDINHSITNPNYSEIIYAKDLGCQTLITCEKQITINQWSFEQATTYTIGFGVILNTESQQYTNPITFTRTNILATYTAFETARILQVFERPNFQYTNTEPIPLVLQVRDDSMRNLESDYQVFMQIDVNVGGLITTEQTRYNPIKFYYDDTAGYNYWFFNNIFLYDNGNLVDDGVGIKPKAYIVPTKTGVTPTGFGLTKKCLTYPSDFFKGSFLFNWIGLLGDATYGCTDVAPQVISSVNGYVGATQIDINAEYQPLGGQNESVFCLRTDANTQYKATLGDSFICGVLYLKSEQQLNSFNVYLGNAYSDYAKTGSEAQYINFPISTDEVMFNDILMMRSALLTEYNTTQIHTFGQLLAAGLNKIAPLGQPLVDAIQLEAGNGVFITNVGSDINLDGILDPTKVSGVFFFKVDGLSVINMNDYTSADPNLDTLDPSQFLTYANAKGIVVPIKKATITVYSRDFSAKQRFKVDSPIVIFEKPNPLTTTSSDSNKTVATPIALKFNFIVDLLSNNNTSAYRAFVPIVFSYTVPNAQQSVNWADFFRDPLGFTTNFILTNWFILFMGVIFALVVATIYAFISKRKG